MNGKKVFGILLVIIGIFLLLNETGVIDITLGDIISNYWPLIIVVIGMYKLLINSISKITGAILVIIGILLQLKISGYFNIFAYDLFWPIVIILLGIWILLSSKRKESWKVSTKDTLNIFALFSGFNIRNTSQNFRGGNITAIFGGTEIDLREATILKEQEAVLDVFIAFGGAEIYVPQEWNVVIKVVPVFGGWENKTINNNKEDSTTLIINGFVMFGGFEVKN